MRCWSLQWGCSCCCSPRGSPAPRQRRSRQVLAQDTQSRGEGERSVSTVTLGRGSGSQEVVPLQTVAPQFRGALVVCAGGDDPGVRLQVIRAVSALTGLGSDCITVCQGDP